MLQDVCPNTHSTLDNDEQDSTRCEPGRSGNSFIATYCDCNFMLLTWLL